MVKRKEVPSQITLTLLASVGTVASGGTRRLSAGSRKKDQGGKLPVATIQAVETVSQIQPGEDDLDQGV